MTLITYNTYTLQSTCKRTVNIYGVAICTGPYGAITHMILSYNSILKYTDLRRVLWSRD